MRLPVSAAAFFLLSIGACAGAPARTEAPPPSAAVQREGGAVPAPFAAAVDGGKVQAGDHYVAFTAPLLTGGDLDISAYEGKKVLVLQFWAVRCSPCVSEIAFLCQLQERFGASALQVIGVNTDSAAPDQIAVAMKSRGISPCFPVVHDAGLAIAKRYTQWLIPVTVVIGQNGVVKSIHTGYNSEVASALERDLQELLGAR